MDGCLLEAGCYFIGWQLPTHCSRQTETWKDVKGRGEHFLYRGVREAHPDILDKAWERLKWEEGETDRDGWTVVKMEGFLKCDLVKKTTNAMLEISFFSFLCSFSPPKCIPFDRLNISHYETDNKLFLCAFLCSQFNATELMLPHHQLDINSLLLGSRFSLSFLSFSLVKIITHTNSLH